jgi:hypothetical protein
LNKNCTTIKTEVLLGANSLCNLCEPYDVKSWHDP